MCVCPDQLAEKEVEVGELNRKLAGFSSELAGLRENMDSLERQEGLCVCGGREEWPVVCGGE